MVPVASPSGSAAPAADAPLGGWRWSPSGRPPEPPLQRPPRRPLLGPGPPRRYLPPGRGAAAGPEGNSWPRGRPPRAGAAPPPRLLWTLISMTSLMDLVNSTQQTGEGGNKCIRFPKSKVFSAPVPLMVCYADSNKCCFQLIDRGDLF